MPDTLRILLVEDDADTRRNMRDILEFDRHHVLLAPTAAAARQLAADHPIWLVILDRRLPDATAEEFLPELRQIVPSAEIVVVTGYTDMGGTLAAMRHGVADYLLKPINPDALRNCLNRLQKRRQIEADLRREQQFADLILQTADVIVLVLDLQGRIVRFNPYFERISGWALQDVCGKDWFTLCLRPEDQAWLRDVFRQTVENRETCGVIHSILTQQGSERQIRWSNTVLPGEGGRSNSVLSVGVDVTDVLEAQDRVLQSERLAAIGLTMAGLAHESRNALQRIQAGLEMLGLDLHGDPEARRDLDSIQRATDDLNNLLEEVRSFAAPIHLHREATNLSAIWRRVWRRLELAHPHREMRLVESFACDQPIVQVDSQRIEQVFRNLFENALAACHDPVQVNVRCCCQENAIEISVQDNGPGLTGDVRKKIFEPFFTTKNAGTGLGMSIVQRIVEAHQGSISLAEMSPHDSLSGAQFILRLQRSASAQTQPGL